MSKKFNLLSLHSPTDIHPRSWICLGGPKIKIIFGKLEKDVRKQRGWSRRKLSRELQKNLKCCMSAISQILQAKRKFYPISIILELLILSENKKVFLNKFKKNIESLKVNSASAKPVRAIHNLNANLAKILGAFMADGSLSVQIVIAAHDFKSLKKIKIKLKKLEIHYSAGYMPSRNQYYISIQINKNNFQTLHMFLLSLYALNQTHYNLELIDEYKDGVEAFIGWIKKEFGVRPNRFKKVRNAWRVSYSNKILARYLMCFFGVWPGPKAYHAFEPKIIQRSNLKIRKSFARGVLMFDGSVREDGKISFSSVSRHLFTSLKQIWEKDDIKFGKSINQKRNNYNPKSYFTCFVLFSTADNRKGEILKYFEPNTQKWKLLKWLSGDLNYVPILKKQRFSSSLDGILKILKRIKRCDTIFLQDYFKCNFTVIRTHLKVLRNQRKIRLSNRPSCINDYISKNATLLLKRKTHDFIFEKVRDKFGKDLNLADILRIHKSTFSAWRLRKNRMPIYIVRKMCKLLKIDFKKVSKDNIEKMDREIAEII